MKDFLILVGVFAVVLLLNKFVLPRLGIPT
jgi:antibiotic biosynthesis monooxygenase (ABM) superfamily enzyme